MSADRAKVTKHITSFANQVGVFVTDFSYKDHAKMCIDSLTKMCGDEYVDPKFAKNIVNSIGFDKGLYKVSESKLDNYKQNHYYSGSRGLVAMVPVGFGDKTKAKMAGCLFWSNFFGTSYPHQIAQTKDDLTEDEEDKWNSPILKDDDGEEIDYKRIIDLQIICSNEKSVGRTLLAKFLRTVNTLKRDYIFTSMGASSADGKNEDDWSPNPRMENLSKEFGFKPADVVDDDGNEWDTQLIDDDTHEPPLFPYIRANDFDYSEVKEVLNLDKYPRRGVSCSRSVNVRNMGFDSYGRKVVELSDERCNPKMGYKSPAFMLNPRDIKE
jgi:hypothetical protein